jgi:peptidyl-prolyl cis-trans isomerase C
MNTRRQDGFGSAVRAGTLVLALYQLAACNKSEPPVGTVNGTAVTKAEWDAYLKFKRIKSEGGQAPKGLLDEYLGRKALAQTIEQEKLLDGAAIAVELDEFKKEMLISRYFEKFLDDKASAQAVKNYYDTHAAQFSERKVHVAHILFRLNSKMSPEERKAKLTAAQDAYSQLKTGKEFAEIAKAMSEDTISGKTGGDLGWLRQGSVAPAFSATAFKLSAGELSAPFETQFGYHIVKVLEAAQTIKQPLEAVQGDIRYQLRAEAKKAEMDRLLAKSKVEVTGGGKPASKPEQMAKSK